MGGGGLIKQRDHMICPVFLHLHIISCYVIAAMLEDELTKYSSLASIVSSSNMAATSFFFCLDSLGIGCQPSISLISKQLMCWNELFVWSEHTLLCELSWGRVYNLSCTL